MAVKPISVAIVGDDRNVQKTFDRVIRRTAQVASSGEKFSAGLRKIGDETGVAKLAANFQRVGRRVAGAAESMGRFAPALAGLTGAATIAGLARLVETWTGFGSKLGNDARRIGIASRNLQGLQGAARLAGSSAEALTSGLMTLGDNLTDAVGGRSPETIQMMSTLGIAFQDASGHARTAEAVLPQLADRIAAIKNPALQARAATALFGSAGEELLPFLRRGAAGIAEYNAQAIRYGVINQDGVRAANAMREAQARLGLAVDGVGYSIAERLAPVLVPMLDRLSDWVAAHRDQIAGFFKDVADRIQRWVDSDGPQKLQARIEEVGKSIQQVVDRVGGWTNAFELVAGAIALKLLAPLLSVIAVVMRLTTALTVGLVEGFVKAGAAANLFSLQTMKLPVFRVLAMTMGIVDSVSGGIPVDKLAPEQRRLLGLPEAPTNGGQEQGDNRTWWQRIAPGWAGGRKAPGTAANDNVPAPVPMDGNTQVSGGRQLTPQSFQNQYGANAEWIGKQLGVDPRTILGQMDLESGTGSGLPGRNNPFNLTVLPNQDGNDIGDGHRYGNYKTLEEASAEFASRIKRKWPDAVGSGSDFHRYIAGLHPGQQGGYAELGQEAYEARVNARRNRYSAFVPAAPAPPAPPVAAAPAPIAGAGSAGANGTTTVRLEHVNPPPGLQTSVQTTGDVQYGGLRIERPQLGSSP